jgi:hypothetical protein
LFSQLYYMCVIARSDYAEKKRNVNYHKSEHNEDKTILIDWNLIILKIIFIRKKKLNCWFISYVNVIPFCLQICLLSMCVIFVCTYFATWVIELVFPCWRLKRRFLEEQAFENFWCWCRNNVKRNWRVLEWKLLSFTI